MPVAPVTIPFLYNGFVLRVVDGDTLDVVLSAEVDYGFRIIAVQTHELRLRLYGINAPEMKTEAGPPARDHLTSLLGAEGGVGFAPLVVATLKDKTEKYGRYLAVVKVRNLSVNDQMVADGHAVPYFP